MRRAWHPHVRAAAQVARVTALEAWRGAWLRAALGALAVAAGAAFFAQTIALTEARAQAAAVFGGLARLALALVVISATAFGLAREWASRQVAFALAGPAPGAVWLAGRLAGLALACLATAVAAALAALPWAPPWAAAAWAASLGAELWLLAAFATFVGVVVRQGAAALALVVAFYALARTWPTIVLLAAAGGGGGSQAVVHAISWLLPALGTFAPAAWLAGDGAPGVLALARQTLETLLYGALLWAAAAIDLRRRPPL